MELKSSRLYLFMTGRAVPQVNRIDSVDVAAQPGKFVKVHQAEPGTLAFIWSWPPWDLPQEAGS